ncbi:MAG: DNA ligase [Desulfobacteraceae bacterium]|nr:DNA ligase [Desulfobacteraceae bacterium]
MAEYKRFNFLSIIGLFLLLVFCPVLVAQEFALQRPKTYTHKEEIVGWVMSEKLDGIRAYWDGSKLFTRKGFALYPPPWFVKNFPSFELDGELWSKRGEFELIQSIVLDKKPGDGWEKISYNIFEVPNGKGDFLSRLNRAKKWFETHKNIYIRFIPQLMIKGRSDLDEFFNEIESSGGEGVVVKNPKMPYHTGRTAHVLKVKKFADMEGVIIGSTPGKGKYKEMMGSLTLELKNGIVFKLGTGFTDQVRKKPPPPGTIVTFKCTGFTKNGIPKFASFLRVRQD